MDYQYGHYNVTPQSAYPQYHQLGLQTPTHTGSANSDDFGNSPPVRAQSFHYSHSHFQYQLHHSPLTIKQDVASFDQFPNYDHHHQDYGQYHHGLPHQKPPTPVHKPAITANNGFEISPDMNDHGINRGSNSDDDDNMTPAQSRRKAQNRAAQRAFRERKERHVKDLEAKLAAMEKNSASVAQENERLKLQLQKAATENEILKATSGGSRGGSEPLPNAGPLRYSPTDFYSEVLHAHENKTPSHRIVTSENGDRLYAAGAAWDYIIKHPLFERGLVDVGSVSDFLKECAKCDGQGPVFEERAIIHAIEKSVASGSDELL